MRRIVYIPVVVEDGKAICLECKHYKCGMFGPYCRFLGEDLKDVVVTCPNFRTKEE